MAATTYTTTNPVTIAQLAPAYETLSLIFTHLAQVKRQQGVNLVITALVLNGDNTVSMTFANALPLNAAQLAHLGIA